MRVESSCIKRGIAALQQPALEDKLGILLDQVADLGRIADLGEHVLAELIDRGFH